MAYKHVFTVFTPTYNRAHTLPRVWESLRSQTFRDFEWLIVDDNSQDATAELVEHWRAEADFPVRFYRQQKRGMHLAFNLGAELAEGELFLPLDSDDGCVPEALERFLRHWRAIAPDKRNGFSSVTGLCVDQRGNLVGEKFPRDVMDSDSLEMQYRWKVKGEKWGFHRTDVMRRFPFPELNHRALPQGIVWSAIARHYKTRYVNEITRVYWLPEPGSDCITAGGIAVSGAAGYAYWHETILNGELDWFRYAPLYFLRSAAHFSRFSFHSGTGLAAQYKKLSPTARLLWLAALPAGAAAWLRDKIKNR